jgi:hypothetical protein
MSIELPADAVPLVESLKAPTGDKAVYQAPSAIEITLADGRKVGMAVPKMALADKIASVMQHIDYKNPVLQQIEYRRVKMLLYITDIDGVTEAKISDPIMRAALEQKIGDAFLDGLFVAFVENFPDHAVLSVVKK